MTSPPDDSATEEAAAATDYALAVSSWGEEELAAIREVLASGRLTMGPRVREFEAAFAASVGAKHAVMVNSGSSANLLAVSAQLYRGKGALAPGDEVLVPAISWSTTFFSVHQAGLDLRFVDVDPETFNLDPARVEEAITERTRAAFATDLLGGACDFAALEEICRRRGLLLLEDACESLGGTHRGRAAGTFGLCGTYSTFFSHHLNTVEGGMIVTGDDELSEILTALRAHGWTRELPRPSRLHSASDDDFHELFRFILPGYNVRPTEIGAAVGLRQLEKLPRLLAGRRRNAEVYREIFGPREDVAIHRPLGESSWFSLALVLEGRLAGRRDELARYLASHGVETRPVVSGNFLRQPVVRHLRHTVAGPLPQAERLDREGILVGNHHLDLAADLERLAGLLDRFGGGA